MSETVQGSLIGVLGSIALALVTWLLTRGKNKSDAGLTQAQIDAKARQEDIDLIIRTLQGQVTSLLTRVQSAEEKADRADARAAKAEERADEAEGRADKAKALLREHERTIVALQARVQELEGKQEGC